MKQTAVEWLVDNLKKNHGLDLTLYSDFNKAKLIEIDQMRAVNMLTYMNKDFDFEQYIKEHHEQSK